MINKVLTSIFGSQHERDIKKIQPLVAAINAMEPEIQALSDDVRKASYLADVTYGTNTELGFDYLRDNMKFDLESMVQRGHHYAIVDEVDSILIDEARTPLIISGPSEESVDKYYAIDRVIPRLVKGEEIDEGDG